MDRPIYEKRGNASDTYGELGHSPETHRHFESKEFEHEHHHSEFAHERHHAYHPGKPGFAEKPLEETVP
jgi:ABC-type nickel/cobalt efflux system permease component RcnA